MNRFLPSLCVALFALVIYSCSDSNETPDTKAPEITVTTPAENSRVKGTITISATAEDISKDITLQVFLDGSLLKEIVANEITAEADTKTLAEGVHTIKITAMDKAGNGSDKIFNIEVRNTLFTIKVPSNYLESSTSIFFSLSKNDGSTMITKQMKNGEAISIPTPEDFNPDSSFVYTQYFYFNYPESNSNPGYLIKTINIYAGITAGEFKLRDFGPSRSKAGSHHLTVSDVPATTSYNVIIRGQNIPSITGNFGATGVIDTDIDIYGATSSDLFLSLTNNSAIPTYKYISSIQAGGSTQFSATEMQQMQTGLVTTKDAAGLYSIEVDGYEAGASTGINFYPRKDNYFTDSKLRIFYPAIAFPKYAFDLTYSVGNTTYENQVIAAVPPTTFQYMNVETKSMSYAGRKMKVVSTGDFDVITFSGSESTFNGNTLLLTGCTIFFAAGNSNHVVVPGTPKELSVYQFISPDDFKLTKMGVADYTDLSGPSDYQNKIVFSADNLYPSERPFIGKYSEITVSGGRVSSRPKIKLPEELANIVKNHLPGFNTSLGY
jgi:hypothetical protein